MSQITTHILDTALGKPAAGVPVLLSQVNPEQPEQWHKVAEGITNEDGRVPEFGPEQLEAGTYRMRFSIAPYLNATGQAVFYPYADVVFSIDGRGEHYHIPLLLSPFGYSTYRGS
ncbi:MAG: hydroxyisourate hydrolase [Pseudomonadota bacterium]|nr:hydroxyisourate hydrolase [Pseudomonadota bacterium]